MICFGDSVSLWLRAGLLSPYGVMTQGQLKARGGPTIPTGQPPDDMPQLAAASIAQRSKGGDSLKIDPRLPPNALIAQGTVLPRPIFWGVNWGIINYPPNFPQRGVFIHMGPVARQAPLPGRGTSSTARGT